MILNKPNLPQGKVNAVVVSGADKEIIARFESIGITPIICKSDDILQDPVKSHADMSFLHITEKICLISKLQTELKFQLEKLGYTCVTLGSDLKREYPGDCLLNAAVIGGTVIYNPKSADAVISDIAEKSGLRVTTTSQGYTKCSVLPVNENAFITSDKSIYRSSIAVGFDALYVNPAGIELPGYGNGFIGGCGGLIGKNTLAICGELSHFAEGGKIMGFCNNYGTDIISLIKGQLRDIGSILPVSCE